MKNERKHKLPRFGILGTLWAFLIIGSGISVILIHVYMIKPPNLANHRNARILFKETSHQTTISRSNTTLARVNAGPVGPWNQSHTAQATATSKLEKMINRLSRMNLIASTGKTQIEFKDEIETFVKEECVQVLGSNRSEFTDLSSTEESKLILKTLSHFMNKEEDSDELNEKIKTFISLPPNSAKDVFLNLHEFSWNLDSRICEQSPFLVGFVHSAPDHFEQRQEIRKTFGSIKRIDTKSIRTVFMLGQSLNSTKQESIANESKHFQDIVQGNFIDSYRNLTYKHIMAYHWINTNCRHVDFIMKIDDDTMVNMYKIVDYLKGKSTKNLFHCYRLESLSIPFRRPNARVYVPEHVYPFYRWPKSCLGFGYIVTQDIVTKILETSRDAKFINTDDVFVTGILTLKAGVDVTTMSKRDVELFAASEQRNMSCEYVKNLMFVIDRDKGQRVTFNGYWERFDKCKSINHPADK